MARDLDEELRELIGVEGPRLGWLKRETLGELGLAKVADEPKSHDKLVHWR